jgi:hypothetical protein
VKAYAAKRQRLTVPELVDLADTLSFEALMTRCGLDLSDEATSAQWEELHTAYGLLEEGRAALRRAEKLVS